MFQGRKDDTLTRFAPFDEGGQGLEGDEEHLGEGEGGTYIWALPEKLFVCPYIPRESNTVVRRELMGGGIRFVMVAENIIYSPFV